MNTGTKVFLAVFACFIGVLVVYYGVLMPRGNQASLAPNAAPGAAGDAKSTKPSNPANSDRNANSGHPNDSRRVPPVTDMAANQPTTPAPDSGLDSNAVPGATPVVHETNGDSAAHSEPTSDSPGLSAKPNELFPAGMSPGIVGGPAASAPPPHAGSSSPQDKPANNETDVKPIAPQPLPAAGDSAKHEPAKNEPTKPVPSDNGKEKGSAKESKDSKPSGSSPSGAESPGTASSKKASPPTTFEYVVQAGDTMSSIAEEWFGDKNKWSMIAKENPLVDPSTLHIGQKLRLPPKDAQPTKVKEQVAASGASGPGTYVVRSGDTLAKIAREVYDDVSKWKTIYDANKSVIGDDPASLKAGMKLKIPEQPKKQASATTKPKAS